jgi:hypothetical protein
VAIAGISQSTSGAAAYDQQAQGKSASGTLLAAVSSAVGGNQPQISVLGQVKVSLEDLQSKAQALQNFSGPPTATDLTLAVQAFAQSYNNLQQVVASSQSANTNSNNDHRANQVQSDVLQALNGPSGDNTLQQVGIEQLPNGQLTVNTQQLGAALQNDQTGTLNTLGQIASRVENAAGKHLPGNGNNGQEVQNLSPNAQAPVSNVAQEHLDQHRYQQQREAVQQQAAVGNYANRNAVAHYFSVASL